MSKCIGCGQELTTGDGTGFECQQCRVKRESNFRGGLSGWICPVCGRGNSPYTSTCPCEPFPNKVTC